MRKSERIADMNPSEVLLFFISCTRPYLRALESAELVELLAVFRAYIIGGYQEAGLEVSPRLEAVWARCLPILRRYIERDKQEAAS